MKKLLAALAALCLTLAPVALAEPENTATLYVVANGEEVGQYPLGYSGN